MRDHVPKYTTTLEIVRVSYPSYEPSGSTQPQFMEFILT